MSTQIAIRLPDEQVVFLDGLVKSGEASSRTEVITSAVEREIRRRMAIRDAHILANSSESDDLDLLIDWAGQHYA
ncbi:ribbon-helix-helix domain-containing protein [Corynebacterium sp. H128]|uniref:ribbon-helix-helix domain-containing protein n=1 Tax=unclassified Corynebacterium TaxID=2624378 RepID=UPI00309BB12F